MTWWVDQGVLLLARTKETYWLLPFLVKMEIIMFYEIVRPMVPPNPITRRACLQQGWKYKWKAREKKKCPNTDDDDDHDNNNIKNFASKWWRFLRKWGKTVDGPRAQKQLGEAPLPYKSCRIKMLILRFDQNRTCKYATHAVVPNAYLPSIIPYTCTKKENSI